MNECKRMTEFKSCIDNYIGEHIWRMVKAQKKTDEISALIDKLRSHRLNSELLEKDTCEELKKVLSFQYEDTGLRLTTNEMQIHMRSFIDCKLQKITQLLKSS